MVCNPKKAKRCHLVWQNLALAYQTNNQNQQKQEICLKGQWRAFSPEINDPNNDILSVFAASKTSFYCRRQHDAHLQTGFSVLTKNNC